MKHYLKFTVISLLLLLAAACGKPKLSPENLDGNWTFDSYTFYHYRLNGDSTEYQKNISESGYLNFESGSMTGFGHLPFYIDMDSMSINYKEGLPVSVDHEVALQSYEESGGSKPDKRPNLREWNSYIYSVAVAPGNQRMDLKLDGKNKLFIRIMYADGVTGNSDGYTCSVIELKK